MHIPENYLSPSTCAVMTAAMLPVWGYSINKVRTEIPKAKMPLLGIGAAFSFLGMMFNVPLPGGTTGHAVGGTLIAILTGSPAAGCISVSIALLIQALLFGDGGILAFGANCFNMAFVLPYLGFFLYKLLFKKTGKRKCVNTSNDDRTYYFVWSGRDRAYGSGTDIRRKSSSGSVGCGSG